MFPIHPINQETCRRFIGFPVVAVMRDRTMHSGILSKWSKGRIILNEPLSAETNGDRTGGGKKAVGPRKKKNSPASAPNFVIPDSPAGPGALPPAAFSPFGPRVELDPASIEMLFAVGD